MSHYDTAEPAADDDFGLVDFDFADSGTPAAEHAEHNESPALPGDEFDYANMDDADFEMLVDNPPTETATAIHSDTEGAGQHTEELVDFTEENLIEPDSIAEDAGSSSLPDDEKPHDSLSDTGDDGMPAVNPTESGEVSVLAPAPSGHADEDTNGAGLPAGTPAELIGSPALRTAGTDDGLAATDNYDSLVTDPFESATSPALPPADFVHDVEGTHAVDHSVYDHQTEDDVLVNYEDSDVEAEIEEIRTVSSASLHEVVDLTDDADIEAAIDAELALSLETDPTRRVPDAQVPVTWVFCEGDWMVYLGPEQTSYDAEYQHVLFHMSIAQLINNLHTDTLLKDEAEIALEFPSLGLRIDMRDQESFEITLAQLYKCHVAAVEESQLPSGLASSPYFTSASASNYCPSPESFAFVIHTRNSVQSTLEHIMHTLSQHEASIEAVIPPSEDPVTVEGSIEPESVDEAEPAAPSEEAAEHVPESADDEDDAPTAEAEQGTTADLLADNLGNGEDEEADADYEVEEAYDEDDDAVEATNDDGAEFDEETVDELEVVVNDTDNDVAQEPETHVNSAAASPSNKRTSDAVDIDDPAEESDLEDRATKRRKNETAADESLEAAA